MTAIEMERISKSFNGTSAVKDCDLRVSAGEILALLGPSGSGKTTLLRLIAGLERPDHGRIIIKERLVVDTARSVWVPPEDRGVGMVFQDYALFPHLTVAQNVRLGLHKAPKKERESRVAELLRLTGLEHCAERYPHELSGGQQQRVALARALAPRPGVILLDEPFNGLDPELRPQMRREVARILRHLGAASILVTHDQEEALGMADQVAVIRNGELQQIGTPEDIYYAPRTPFVANFVGYADFIPGIVSGDEIRTEIGNFPRPPDLPEGPVKLMIRHESVNSKPGGVPATVEEREFLGGEILYRLRLPSGATVHLEQRQPVHWPVGHRVTVEVHLPNVVAFPASSDHD
ncbi:MAG TPA: ABC transporter ATP-binding protein [candidate division Zixibacteria bacterium]|nr:ABC transporter ATP-binding protein [candidate division Zixibacteria bacterium]